MKHAKPIFCVLYDDAFSFDDNCENFKCFETFEEAEQFRNFMEECGCKINSMVKI